MNANELTAQLQFFKDIGVESLSVGAAGISRGGILSDLESADPSADEPPLQN